MTCVVGLEVDGGVLLGADSSATDGRVIRERAQPKVFKLRPKIAVAYTTSFRMGQLLQYELHLTSPARSHDLEAWMATTFVPKVRTVLRKGGYLQTENGQESGGDFLVAVHDRLFWVGSDLQFGRCADGFDAAGAGEQFALGAFYATQETTDPNRRMRIALDAAARFSLRVAPPFRFEAT